MARTIARRREQAARIAAALAGAYPDAWCALQHRNPYELLVATILSAQCTDERVNQVTPALFARYPQAKDLAASEPTDLEGLIRSTGFFKAKAKNLRAMAKAVVERHGGEIPADLDALTALAGVGRKTANVVLGTAFGIASGVVVDTHVKRLAFRMGLTRSDDPERIELDLAASLPREQWIDFGHRLIQHGRSVCHARSPKCDACPMTESCPKRGVSTSRAARPRPKAEHDAHP